MRSAWRPFAPVDRCQSQDHTGTTSWLTSASSTSVPCSTVAVIAYVPRPKDTVQQPMCHPIRAVLPVCRTSIEQLSRYSSSTSILPRVDDGSMLALFGDVVPEEGWLVVGIIALLVRETAAIVLQSTVHAYGLILVACQYLASFVDLRSSNSLASLGSSSRGEGLRSRGSVPA